MKTGILLLFLGLSLSSFSQGRFVQMTNNRTGDVRMFHELKRVKIKTLDDKKFIGKLVILDTETIVIKGQEIKLNQIKKLKNRSVLAGIFGTVLISYGGLLVAVSPIAYSGMHGSDLAAGSAIFLTGTVVTLSGVFMNEFVNTHHTEKWDYKIIINE